MLDADRLDEWAAAFSVLGRFHREPPDAATLDAFWELIHEWPLTDSSPSRDGVAEVAASRSVGETPGQIRRDHDYLYGRTAVARVAPYESVHRGIERLVFDEHTLRVREAYRALALQAPRLNKEPDDHIGLEFDFIAQACLKTLEALEQGDRERASHLAGLGVAFFTDHLQQWAPDMLPKVATQARTHFMKGIALLSLGALEAYADGIGTTAD